MDEYNYLSDAEFSQRCLNVGVVINSCGQRPAHEMSEYKIYSARFDFCGELQPVKNEYSNAVYPRINVIKTIRSCDNGLSLLQTKQFVEKEKYLVGNFRNIDLAVAYANKMNAALVEAKLFGVYVAIADITPETIRI